MANPPYELFLFRGDAANAIRAAAGYNFRCLMRWLSILWRLFLGALLAALQPVLA
jgi:transposase, IS5 family